jgi:hypothetical protein
MIFNPERTSSSPYVVLKLDSTPQFAPNRSTLDLPLRYTLTTNPLVFLLKPYNNYLALTYTRLEPDDLTLK